MGGLTLPQPYYDDGQITIYHGDCREILPALDPVDLVLTDPPYGIDGGSGSHNRKRGKGNYFAAFEDTPEYIETVAAAVIRYLVERTPSVIVTPGNTCMMLYPQPDSFGVFYQPAAVGLQTFGNLDAQPILYYGKNQTKKNFGTPCSYVLTEAPEKNGHPCVKPIKAWKKLLANTSLPGHTVLDPFMGSGTTLRAAKDLGRRAIGIEIEERYCEIAVKRLAQSVLPLEIA